MNRRWHYIVSQSNPRGGDRPLRLFSDGADAYRWIESTHLNALNITLMVDGSTDLDGTMPPHVHYWAVKSWTWENYRWENREPAADCIPVKDACPCGKDRPHIESTPWPPASDSPMPPYEVVRAEAGPRPRASRSKKAVA